MIGNEKIRGELKMNKRNVVLEELKKGAEPFGALVTSTQHYINVIVGETMPISREDTPALLTALKLLSKSISEDHPKAAKVAEEAFGIFAECGKVINVEAESREEVQETYEKIFEAEQRRRRERGKGK